MTNKHTPGPKIKDELIEDIHGGYKIINPDNWETIATVYDKENLPLLAAAPELLAALERVLECHRLRISLDTNAGALVEARAAIAKAKGE